MNRISSADSASDATAQSTLLAIQPLTREQCQLVEKHYPQVRAVVSQMRSYLPSCADLDELHSVGLVGLIAAVRRFNAAQTKTFDAYAAMRIRGAILDELRRLDWMPRSARQSARHLRGTVDALEQTLGRVPTSEETRAKLGLNQGDFDRLQTRTQPVRFVPLDQPVAQDSGGSLNLHDCIADEETPSTLFNLEHAETIASLLKTVKHLPDRQRKVIVMYYFDGKRLAEIALEFGVTEARVCQIHSQALQQLRQQWTERN